VLYVIVLLALAAAGAALLSSWWLIRRRPKPPRPRPWTRRDPYSTVKQHRIEDDRPDDE
jgi:hypothetical protein